MPRRRGPCKSGISIKTQNREIPLRHVAIDEGIMAAKGVKRLSWLGSPEVLREKSQTADRRRKARPPCSFFLSLDIKPCEAGITTAESLGNWIHVVVNWAELAVLLPDASNYWSRVALQDDYYTSDYAEAGYCACTSPGL